MACKNCKDKQTLKEDMYNSTKLVDSWVVWFSIVWSVFAIYGIYSLISNIL